MKKDILEKLDSVINSLSKPNFEVTDPQLEKVLQEYSAQEVDALLKKNAKLLSEVQKLIEFHFNSYEIEQKNFEQQMNKRRYDSGETRTLRSNNSSNSEALNINADIIKRTSFSEKKIMELEKEVKTMSGNLNEIKVYFQKILERASK